MTGPVQKVTRPAPEDRQEGVVDAKTGQRRLVKTTTRSDGKDDKAGGVVCVLDDEGTCSIHGPGAREMSKPVTCVLTKKKWYKCE